MKSPALAATLLIITFNASANDAAMEACREKLKKANQLDVLYQFDWPKGRRPLVVAGPCGGPDRLRPRADGPDRLADLPD
jgi:hypothetical protein